jgi:hypothetical protein
LEGKAATKKKGKKTHCTFLDSHSLRNGFKVFGVKVDPTTVVLNMNYYVLIFCKLEGEMVLILNNYKKV